MAGVKVPVSFEADLGDAQKQFSKFANSVTDDLSKIKIGTAITAGLDVARVAFDIAAAAAQKLNDVIGHTIDEAVEAQQTLQGLKAALAATGDLTENNVAQFQNLATELSEISKFSDDVVLSQVKIGKQFGLTNREVAKLLKVSVDYASFTGEDLDTVVRQLGQTFDGTAGRLAQTIPELQKVTAEQLKNGIAVDILAKKYKGFSEKSVDTFIGQQQQITNTIKNISEAFGSTIVENTGVIILMKAIRDVLRDVEKFVNTNKKAIADFISDAVIVAVKGLEGFLKVVSFVIKETDILISQLQLVGTSFIAIWQALQGRLSTAVGTLTTGWKKYNSELEKTQKRGELFDKAILGADALAARIEEARKNNEELNKSLKRTKKGFDDSKDAAARLALAVAELAAKVQEAFKNPFSLGKNQESFGRGKIGDKISDKDFTGIASGLGVANFALQGAEGARNLISSGVGTLASTYLGPLGPIVGQLAGELTKGPEHVKAMVTQFADAIPDMIQNLIEALPVLIETLADKSPEIIERLAERSPEIITKLVQHAPRLAFAFQLAFAKAGEKFVEKILEGAGKFIDELVKGVGDAFKVNGGDLFGGGFDVKGGILNGGIGSIVGGPIGGTIGTIIGGGGGGFHFKNQGKSIQINLQVGQKQLASSIVDLQRQGFRVVAP